MFAKKKEQLKKMFSLFPKQQVEEYVNTEQYSWARGLSKWIFVSEKEEDYQ